MNKIGLKLANGEFYPILEDGAAARKRLVVTTVQDGQKSVQIDLYRGSNATVEDTGYIGSLVIEDIPQMGKGEPDIRMDLDLSADDTLNAYAEETSSGANQSLRVSLRSLAEEEKYEIPDFEFSSPTGTAVFTDEDFEGTDSLPPEEEVSRLLAPEEAPVEPRPPRRPLLVALFVLLVLALALALAFLVYNLALGGYGASGKDRKTATAQDAPRPPITQPPLSAAPEPTAAAAPLVSSNAATVQPTVPPVQAPTAAKTNGEARASPQTTASPPAVAPAKSAKGVTYKIKWGDTLWDLAYVYYRNPWLYPRIAVANKIRNPDLIIAGSKIWIPAR